MLLTINVTNARDKLNLQNVGMKTKKTINLFTPTNCHEYLLVKRGQL